MSDNRTEHVLNKKERFHLLPGLPLIARNEPMLWLTGGALVLSLALIVLLLSYIFYQGGTSFWPQPVEAYVVHDGSTIMGEQAREDTIEVDETYRSQLPEALRAGVTDGEEVERMLIRTANFDVTNTHFHWVDTTELVSVSVPPTATVIERLSWGRFIGTPISLQIQEEEPITDPTAIMEGVDEHLAGIHDVLERRIHLEKATLGEIRAHEESARLESVEVRLEHGEESQHYVEALAAYQVIKEHCVEESASVLAQIENLKKETAPYTLRMATASGQEADIPLEEIVRIYQPNALSFMDKLGLYGARWMEFLFDDPREANSEGGVWPAIIGTVMMTMIMTIFVVPFGVMASLYLSEYAKSGGLMSIIRIAINNLAGVPSIVFGVFGLGFFCTTIGGGLDNWLFPAEVSEGRPVLGKGTILWASATLALLTVPVVIVATEEALRAVPNSMREGSYGCGASKWQTIWRIVMPRALPGIMTGMILAMARGAGEVAPLMLVGAVKLAPELPIDMHGTFIHPERSFMHLGFHIYDLGLQSQNSEAAKPMVFTTTLLLISIVVSLNLIAIWMRKRLARRFVGGTF